MLRLLPRLRGALDRSGVAAVEFAIIAPVMIALLGGAVDIGIAMDRAIRLENAARTAAQYITRMPTAAAAAQNAGLATLAGAANATVTVGAAVCECPPSNAAIGGPVVACTSSCANGMAIYVTVTAAQPFTPIFPTSAIIPFNNLGATSSDVVVRL